MINKTEDCQAWICHFELYIDFIYLFIEMFHNISMFLINFHFFYSQKKKNSHFCCQIDPYISLAFSITHPRFPSSFFFCVWNQLENKCHQSIGVLNALLHTLERDQSYLPQGLSLNPYLSHIAVDLGSRLIASDDMVVWFICNNKQVHDAGQMVPMDQPWAALEITKEVD